MNVAEGARLILERSGCPPVTRDQADRVSAIVLGLPADHFLRQRREQGLPSSVEDPAAARAIANALTGSAGSKPVPRPRRKMPTMAQLAEHLGLLGQDAHCFRCGDVPGSGSWLGGHGLVRAHVVDRVFGGLDHAANLRPLCDRCHSQQPPFGCGDEAGALAWFGGA